MLSIVLHRIGNSKVNKNDTLLKTEHPSSFFKNT